MLQIFCFILILIGLLLCFNFSLDIENIKKYLRAFKIKMLKKSDNKEENLKEYVIRIAGKKKENLFKKTNNEVKTDLEKIGQKDHFKKTQILALLCGVLGFCIGLSLSNLLLAFVMAGGLYFLPLWFTRFAVYKYTRELNEELAVALSMVTTSYIRNNDITAAIKENVVYMQGAVREAFKGFENRMKISPSVNFALSALKDDIDCPLFISWVDTLILCQDDHNIKYALPGIVSKFSNLKKLQMENETKMISPLKTAMLIVFLVVGFVPFLWLLNPAWFVSLLHTAFGQVSLSCAAIACLFIINKAIKLSGPIEFSL